MSPVTICLLSLVTLGCLVVQDDALHMREVERSTSVSDTIKQLIQDMEACADREDKDCFLGHFDEQVVVMRDGHPTEVGKAAARKHLEWIEYNYDATIEVKEIIPTDGSYVVVRTENTMKKPDGQTIYEGKGVFVWKKVGDDYKVYIDMYNDN